MGLFCDTNLVFDPNMPANYPASHPSARDGDKVHAQISQKIYESPAVRRWNQFVSEEPKACVV